MLLLFLPVRAGFFPLCDKPVRLKNDCDISLPESRIIQLAILPGSDGRSAEMDRDYNPYVLTDINAANWLRSAER
jgi:hypothetical protein